MKKLYILLLLIAISSFAFAGVNEDLLNGADQGMFKIGSCKF